MKNEKLENAKSKIVEFYDKHETAIKIGVGVTTLVGFVGWAVYCGKKHPVISGVSGSAFTWSAFIAGALLNAVPGIILHIVLIPILVMALKRAKVLDA